MRRKNVVIPKAIRLYYPGSPRSTLRRSLLFNLFFRIAYSFRGNII